MPIENVDLAGRQGRLFQERLSTELNKKHKLYKLRELINWSNLENEMLQMVNVSNLGRTRKSIRVLLGLSLLQSMYNFSDALSSETLEENVYWQYFCGYEYGGTDIQVSESAIKRFRDSLGEKGHEIILKELANVGLKVGSYKKKDLDSVIIDTTVQIKNITYPHDAKLMCKARDEIVNLSHRQGFKLNNTYEKKYKRSLIQLWKYKLKSQSKKRKKTLKHLKTLLGRLIRGFEKDVIKYATNLSEKDKDIFARVQKIYTQSCLDKNEKKEYKENGNKIMYSFHAEEVECIGKGKLNKPYEFGNKVAIAVSGKNNFIIGVKSFHGNPYDGHTLAQTVENIEKITDEEVNKIFVDLGYRGSNYSKKGKIYTPYTKKKLTKSDKQMQKRRSAVEPVIGHLKQHGRMGKNYLKGKVGDIVNPLLSAIGFNMRNLSKSVTAFT